MRVIITGSRTWTNDGMIAREMHRIAKGCPDEHLVFIHGAAPHGADAMVGPAADVIASIQAGLTVEVEEFPAEWDALGPSAGHIRNQEMADAGADMCLAFSKGWPITAGTASMCAKAIKAGIPVLVQIDAT